MQIWPNCETLLNVVQLDAEGSGMEDERETRLFPDKDHDERITSHDLTQDFLIYGTDVGLFTYFFMHNIQYRVP